jgi:PAS domain S-box-containing protein
VVLIHTTSIPAFAAPVPLNDISRTEIDSLLKLLPFAHKSDKVEILLGISKKYLAFSVDSAHEYAQKALDQAILDNDNKSMAESYKQLGNILFYQGDYKNVIHLYDSSLYFFNLLMDTVNISRVMNNLGIIYNNINDYEKSIDFHLQSLQFKIMKADSAGIANSYNNIGSIYYEAGNFIKSEEFFLKALEVLQNLKEDNSIQSILNNLGLIKQELGDYTQSINYLMQSSEIGERLENKIGLISTYHNLGKSYFLLNNYQEAQSYYFTALDLSNSLGIENCNTLNIIGQLFIELDYYDHALKYLKQAEKVAIKSSKLRELRDIYHNLATVYERTGRYYLAYQTYLQFSVIDDSLEQQIYKSRLEEEIVRFEIEKKQKEFEKMNLQTQLELEKKDHQIRRRNYALITFITGFFAILIFAVLLFRLLQQKKRANELLKQQNEELERSEQVIKNINKALSENEAMLRSVFDASPYPIMVLDTADQILDCNDAGIDMFRAAGKREFIGRNINDFIIADPSGEISTPLHIHLDQKHHTNSQYTFARKDGDSFRAELSAGFISESAGTLKAYVIIVTDITERLTFIESLKLAKLRAEEADRLKTAFLANMSHEIRTPMNSIIGFSNLLVEPETSREKMEEYLAHILQSSNLLLRLIDDIIDISKIEAGQLNINLQECKVNEIVREIFRNFENNASGKKLRYAISLPPESDLHTIKTDPVRLKQILSNLINNALKFTEKGMVEVGYVIRNNSPKPLLEFYVKDSGIGIPKEKYNLIFERFRQIDDSRTRKFGGTGLGLSISKKLVEALDGRIWVESVPEKGSVFYFTLPFTGFIKEDQQSAETFPVTKTDWRGKIILVAEDEDSNYELIKASLHRTNIKIIRAHNGLEALEYIQKNQSVDMVLMDIRMPKMNGYEATAKIKAINPSIPVISITAYAMSEDESKSLEAGCDKYISKPIRPDHLIKTISLFIGN